MADIDIAESFVGLLSLKVWLLIFTLVLVGIFSLFYVCMVYILKTVLGEPTVLSSILQ